MLNMFTRLIEFTPTLSTVECVIPDADERPMSEATELLDEAIISWSVHSGGASVNTQVDWQYTTLEGDQ